jgi:hypothetical protein
MSLLLNEKQNDSITSPLNLSSMEFNYKNMMTNSSYDQESLENFVKTNTNNLLLSSSSDESDQYQNKADTTLNDDDKENSNHCNNSVKDNKSINQLFYSPGSIKNGVVERACQNEPKFDDYEPFSNMTQHFLQSQNLQNLSPSLSLSKINETSKEQNKFNENKLKQISMVNKTVANCPYFDPHFWR